MTINENPRWTREDAERALLLPLCEEIGYGRVMQLAEQLWREKNMAEGQPGGEHTTGPCAVFMVPCACREAGYAICDWCCGAGRVTKRVREVQRNEKRS